MAKITEEELALLSDEEREALAEDVGVTKTPEEIRAAEEAETTRASLEAGGGAAVRNKKPASEKTDDEILAEIQQKEKDEKAEADRVAAEEKKKDDEAAGVGEKTKEELDAIAAEEKRKEDEAKAKEAEDKQAIKDKVVDSILPKAAPPFVLEAESKHGTIEEIDAKIVALDAKFEDGDIKMAEYTASREDLVKAKTEIEMFGKINEQVQKGAAEKSWKDSQVEFFTANPEYSTNRIMNVSIVDAVNRILETEESKKMTDAQIFKLAKEECDAVFFPKAKEPTPTPAELKAAADKEEAEKAAAQKKLEDAKTEDEKKAALAAIKKQEAEKAAGVKTLASVPVSQPNQEDDEFDKLDLLSGEAYEDAVAKLSDAKRAAYAARK